MLEAMRADKKKFIPPTGFNLVGVDDFEKPGEQLYLIGHFDTKEEARTARKKRKKKHPGEVTYVYGPDTE